MVVEGPALFDTSAESYLGRNLDEETDRWLALYCGQFRMVLSPMTVVERMRGYWTMLARAVPSTRPVIEESIEEYLEHLDSECEVLYFDMPCALISAELMALHPNPPSAPHRSHRESESRQDRMSRWRFDIMIAATALVYGLPLIHNNPRDFEAMRMLIEMVPERFPGIGPLNLISVKRLAA